MRLGEGEIGGPARLPQGSHVLGPDLMASRAATQQSRCETRRPSAEGSNRGAENSGES